MTVERAMQLQSVVKAICRERYPVCCFDRCAAMKGSRPEPRVYFQSEDGLRFWRLTLPHIRYFADHYCDVFLTAGDLQDIYDTILARLQRTPISTDAPEGEPLGIVVRFVQSLSPEQRAVVRHLSWGDVEEENDSTWRLHFANGPCFEEALTALWRVVSPDEPLELVGGGAKAG